MCYLIGQNLDKEFSQGMGKFKVMELLSKKSPVGKRFHALYSAKGDELTPPKCEEKETFQLYLETHFPEYLNSGGCGGHAANHFTIFDENPDHPNMEPFYRFQLSGNCFLQAPILMLWYLALWYDKDKAAADVPLIHLSRYARNTFESKFLYEYLFNDAGGESWLVISKLITDRTRMEHMIEYTSSYEDVLDFLKKHGPAVVELDNVPLEDFCKPNKFHYTTLPKMDKTKKTEMGGHSMLLVGVRQDEARQTFFLLQNWWEGKLFVEVRNDYLITIAGDRYGFRFIKAAFELKDEAQVYAQPRTEGARNAQSSPLLERQFRQQGVKQR
ncbi:expressed unknown protein [Seminavis robusta]|uniref:Uncharacterized protein n=1 Tax=Seminavis robusta TaxID=568900 RepID=A0A9N8HDR3_9STRA|nr:expressed unknown protein [Seminavis robusta]|eukprot:Sro354_g124840.1 n/a (328) ;mRNA; f:48688-49671